MGILCANFISLNGNRVEESFLRGEERTKCMWVEWCECTTWPTGTVLYRSV
jgi:hypothetical protein